MKGKILSLIALVSLVALSACGTTAPVSSATPTPEPTIDPANAGNVFSPYIPVLTYSEISGGADVSTMKGQWGEWTSGGNLSIAYTNNTMAYTYIADAATLGWSGGSFLQALDGGYVISLPTVAKVVVTVYSDLSAADLQMQVQKANGAAGNVSVVITNILGMDTNLTGGVDVTIDLSDAGPFGAGAKVNTFAALAWQPLGATQVADNYVILSNIRFLDASDAVVARSAIVSQAQ